MDGFNGTQQFAYDSLGCIAVTVRQRPEDSVFFSSNFGRQKEAMALFTNEAFSFDAAGNLYAIQRTAAEGGGEQGNGLLPQQPLVKKEAVPYNRFTEIAGVALWYDAKGRVVEKNCSTTGANWKYTYNSDDELIEAVQTANTGSTTTRFGYDAFGRRTAAFDGQTLTLFVWEGTHLVQEERGAATATIFMNKAAMCPWHA